MCKQISPMTMNLMLEVSLAKTNNPQAPDKGEMRKTNDQEAPNKREEEDGYFLFANKKTKY